MKALYQTTVDSNGDLLLPFGVLQLGSGRQRSRVVGQVTNG